jgi:hypothetical protein
MKNQRKTSARITILSLIAFILTFSPTFAQKGGQNKGKEKHEKIMQLKRNFFNEQLFLNETEKEKFWNLYDEMEDKIQVSRKETRKVMKNVHSNIETIKDDDLKKNVNQVFDLELAVTNIRKEYYEKTAQVIGYKKATQVLKLEREFKQKLLKELKDKKKENQSK